MKWNRIADWISYTGGVFLSQCISLSLYRRYVVVILPIRRKTLSNQSTNLSLYVVTCFCCLLSVICCFSSLSENFYLHCHEMLSLSVKYCKFRPTPWPKQWGLIHCDTGSPFFLRSSLRIAWNARPVYLLISSKSIDNCFLLEKSKADIMGIVGGVLVPVILCAIVIPVVVFIFRRRR